MSWSTKNRPMNWVQCWVTLAMARVTPAFGAKVGKNERCRCWCRWAVRPLKKGSYTYVPKTWPLGLSQFWRLKALFITILAPEGAVYYNFGAECAF